MVADGAGAAAAGAAVRGGVDVKPVYVIGGFMRSGTSMMMRALEAGGMEACYRKSRDQMKARYADDQYDPNAGGLYELERRDYRRPDFPIGYEGKLIKCLQRGPRSRTMLPPAGTRRSWT